MTAVSLCDPNPCGTGSCHEIPDSYVCVCPDNRMLQEQSCSPGESFSNSKKNQIKLRFSEDLGMKCVILILVELDNVVIITAKFYTL